MRGSSCIAISSLTTSSLPKATCACWTSASRLLQPDLSLRPQQTVVGAAALTPAYAPEQFTGHSVTVATDVYSLGVILFDCSPAAARAPNGRSLGAYEHEVRYVEPPLMSRTARPAEAGALRGDSTRSSPALEKKPLSLGGGACRRHRKTCRAAHCRAATFVRLRREKIRGAMPGRCRSVPAWCCAVGRARLRLVQWKDAERQSMAVERLAIRALRRNSPCSSRTSSPGRC